MLTTVVGSYPKIGDSYEKQKLRRIQNLLDEGKVDESSLYEAWDEATKEAVKEQIESGLDIISDGQIATTYQESFVASKLKGIKLGGLLRYFDTNTFLRQPVIEKDIKWEYPALDFDYMTAVWNSSKPVRAIIPGPYTIAKFSKNEFYKSFDDLVLRLAEELNKEVLHFDKRRRAPIIQIDEPAILRNKSDIELFSKAFAKLVDNVKVSKIALYTYFGDAEGIIDKLQELPADIIGLDFVYGQKNWNLLNGFKKQLGLGIVDARNTKLEDKADLIVSITKSTMFIDPENIFVNPSCGLIYLPRDTAKQKLINMVDATKHAIGLIERAKLEYDVYGRV